MRRRAAAHVLGTLALAALGGGCAAGYVTRAAYEEARLLWRRQPIESLLAGPLDAGTRAKLELTLAVRAFAAADLGLSVGGSYTALARVDAGQVVHVVSAAPRDRLVPYTWWFPIVGDVPYRAYFDAAEARALAASLDAQGYDTDVRPAIAFSTLGWFNDPLLSTLLRDDEEGLAETIVHELLHSTLYVPGQAAFNESFATFVGHRGAQRFFQLRGDTVRAMQAAARWSDALTFSVCLARGVTRLEAAYAAGVDPAARAPLFDALRADCVAQPWRTDEYTGFCSGSLNNAVLMHARLYADRLALFEAAAARNGDDLRATIAWIRSVASRGDPFAALEVALAPAP